MPSYAQDVKNELARIFPDEQETLQAEFAALLFVTKKIDGRLEFTTTNAAVARKFVTLTKKFLSAAKVEVAAVRRKKLRKDLTFVVRIFLTGDVQNFLDELDAPEMLKRSRFKVAWLRGIFLAVGTVNRPEAQYFLTFVTRSLDAAEFVRKQLTALEFNAGLYQRTKKLFVVWLREADAICDFLGMIGATNAVERFEVARNLKEVRIQVNRLVNMDTAAINRAAEAAERQIADIKILLARNYPVTKKIREAMTLRLENPSCNIAELAEKISLSREGLLYRFKKIHRLAKKFSGK